MLTDGERRALLDLPFRVRQVRPNEDFVSLGMVTDHACMVVEGLIGRFDQNRNGDRQITAIHIRGEVPDLHSVVQPTATSALQALATSTIVSIPHPAFRAVLAEYPAIAVALWRDTAVDAMILAKWLVNLGRRDAKSRVAHLLCEMACRYRQHPVDGRLEFNLPMTQQQLADATALTPIHINRTLKTLAEIGTSFRRQTVRIENWGALTRMGQFNRAYLQDELEPEQSFAEAW